MDDIYHKGINFMGIKPKEIKMRWKEETQQRPLGLDFIIARHKIHEAFCEGYINWNIYNLAIERVDRTMNGGWMFKKLKPGGK
ncbi:MAG: hypothetical protein LBQ46_10720 [Treponema sp.]|nr:hypothetical protein [Treponema sp.]